jgi:hypothetical protein
VWIMPLHGVAVSVAGQREERDAGLPPPALVIMMVPVHATGRGR